MGLSVSDARMFEGSSDAFRVFGRRGIGLERPVVK